jgi:PelA/Pel-15E family pectate lyase
MPRLPFALFTIAVALTPAIAQPIKIVLAGDSTVNEEGGWGTGFQACFGPEVHVINLARNGRSSKSFRDEGAWARVLTAKPKYVLIQFGHNDQPGKGPERETDPETTFRANLARYVDEAHNAGAIPILVTSIVRRNFDSSGKIKLDSLVPYVKAVRKLAIDKNVPLIDLYALTLAQSEALGPADAAAFGRKAPDGKLDTTHLSPKGQSEIGIIAAAELARLEPALKPLLHDRVAWKDALRQPAAWYGSAEAIRIADNLLLYQHEVGGWDKNIDMALPLGSKDRAEVEGQKRSGHTTIDNNATYTQMRYLARVYTATRQERFASAVRRGLTYLLAAQYPNGGWPQFYPLREGYWSHITYNDDAMGGVLETLRAIETGKSEYAFLAESDRARARQAIGKGVECILKTQVVLNGKPTAWCAQHDEHTLAPAKARKYELPSLSGSESVGIVRFLMGIDHPSPEIIRAVEGAIAWFSAVKITGIRLDRKPAPDTPKGFDLVVVPDTGAPPLWARFYEIGTNRPMFSGRDGIVKYQMSEIEYERRNGYRWYVDRPGKLLDEDYPQWKRSVQ